MISSRWLPLCHFEVFFGSSPFLVGTIKGLATYEDGSTTWAKSETIVTADPDGKTGRWEGKAEFIQGTGRFEGIQGGIIYTGKRFAPTPGAGAQYYTDGNWTYTLPSK